MPINTLWFGEWFSFNLLLFIRKVSCVGDSIFFVFILFLWMKKIYVSFGFIFSSLTKYQLNLFIKKTSHINIQIILWGVACRYISSQTKAIKWVWCLRHSLVKSQFVIHIHVSKIYVKLFFDFTAHNDLVFKSLCYNSNTRGE